MGPAISDQEYVNGSPSGSMLRVPSSVTVEPPHTDLSEPAFATGALCVQLLPIVGTVDSSPQIVTRGGQPSQGELTPAARASNSGASTIEYRIHWIGVSEIAPKKLPPPRTFPIGWHAGAAPVALYAMV